MFETGQDAKSVGIWLRVSTEDQVKGESPEHHEKRARNYAEARGWHVHEVYRLDAVSGKSVMGHAEAKRMMRDIQTGAISGLVFSKLARLARNTRELLDFSEFFRDHGADLISLQEAIDTSSPAGRLFFTLLGAMAQWEREEIGERVAASVPIRAQLGKMTGGAAPFGYRIRDGRMEPHPEEAPIRVLVHELYAEHQRRHTVARILNERGYRTRRGNEFSAQSIAILLDDPTPKGLHRANYTTVDKNGTIQIKPEKDWVYYAVEPIVSAELWDKGQRILAAQQTRRKPAPKRGVHLFSGLIYCHCGGKMYMRAQSPKYVCYTCNNKFPHVDLEAIYLSQLHDFVVKPEEIEAHNRAALDALLEKERLLAVLHAELAKLDADEDVLIQLYSDKALTKEAFARRHKPIADRRAQIDDELPRLQAQCDVLRINAIAREDALADAQHLPERWPTLDEEQKRQIVQFITERITIGVEDIEIALLQNQDSGERANSCNNSQ